jgi:hypothetical protein
MKKKILGWILKAPAILLLFASVIAGFYAATNKIAGIGFSAPIIILIILILYIIGESIKKDAWPSY